MWWFFRPESQQLLFPLISPFVGITQLWSHCWTYRSLVKKGPWALYLTLSQDKGVGGYLWHCYINLKKRPPTCMFTLPWPSKGIALQVARGSHIRVACRSVCDRDQESWSEKIVLDRLIAPFRGSWSLDFTGVQRTKCSHASLVSKKVRWSVDNSRSEFVALDFSKILQWKSSPRKVTRWALFRVHFRPLQKIKAKFGGGRIFDHR